MKESDTSGQIEKVEDVGTDQASLVTRWLKELELAEQHEKPWRERAEKVVKQYRDERENSENSNSKFNILYSNTDVLKSVLYAKVPIPDVRRRFRDADPTGRLAAKTLERSLSYSIDAYDFDGMMEKCVEDVLLPGRAEARVKYVPTYSKQPVTGPDGPVLDDKGQPQMQDAVVYEEAVCEYVDWDLFRMSPAKRWNKVRWVAFGELLTRDDLESQFGEAGKLCSLNWTPKGMEDKSENDMFKRALVWTIWNKSDRKVYVVSKGYKKAPLNVLDDPLGLEGFFPCPEPLLSITTNDTMIPVPEYIQYQDQAEELNDVTQRITALTDALRRRGVYDASFPELEKLAKAGDNEFIPLENYSNFAEKGGLEKALMESPIDGIAKVLIELYKQREMVKQTIYEITGIADIVRGATDPNETLGAQQLKSRYAGIRVSPRQKRVQKFARDLLRLKAEIMAEHFSPQTLTMMTGTQVTPEVMQLLKNDKLRGFRVDIETDSTIQPDADTEQKNRVEFLTALTGMMEKVLPAVQSGMIKPELAKEITMFGVRAFKVGPQLEEALETLGQAPPQRPDPEAAKAQGEMQARQAELQAETQARQQEMQANMQAKQAEMQQDTMLKRMEMQMDQSFQRWKAELEAATKILVAQIGAKASTEQAAMAQDRAAQEVQEGLNA